MIGASRVGCCSVACKVSGAVGYCRTAGAVDVVGVCVFIYVYKGRGSGLTWFAAQLGCAMGKVGFFPSILGFGSFRTKP